MVEPCERRPTRPGDASGWNHDGSQTDRRSRQRALRHEVRWSLVSVPIAPVAATREVVLAEHFTPIEVGVLLPRHPRTTAGWLAVKRALLEVLRGHGEHQLLCERDLTLSYGTGGRPHLRHVDKLSSDDDFGKTVLSLTSISISHTRARAWGLAVLDEEDCGLAGNHFEARTRK